MTAKYLNEDRVRAWSMPSSWATKWWSPGDLLASVDEQRDLFDGNAFFNAPNLKPLRETYAAATFALDLKNERQTRIRMVADVFPDFCLRIDEAVLAFELVEADRPERKRGEEYRELARREAADEKIDPEPYDPWAEKRSVPEAVRRVVAGKAAKHYADPPHLLVYVNFGNMGGPALTDDEASAVTQDWHATFKSIWLLCGKTAVNCSGSLGS